MSTRSSRSLVRNVIVVIVLLAIGGGAFYVYRLMSVPRVTVTDVTQGPVVQAFYATGTLQPIREFPIKSNVEGIITEVAVDKGDAVAKGKILAVVRVEEYQMAASKARAELELKKCLADDKASPTLAEYDKRLTAEQEQLEIAQRELARTKAMFEKGATSVTDVDRAADRVQPHWSAVESIKAQKATKKLELERDVAVAQAAMDEADWDLQQQSIRSPTAGVVLDRPVALGTRMKINDQLMRIGDVAPSKLVMRAAVDEEDKTRLRDGQHVTMTLYSYPGRVFSGTVQKIYPQADADRRTFEVDITIEPTDDGFSAGMTGELAFVVRTKDVATVVPSQAVVREASSPHPGAGDGAMQKAAVWVVRGGKVERVAIELGVTSIERSEVSKGLSDGDQVVISPIADLREGQSVRTVHIDPATAAGLNKPADSGGTFKGFH